MDDEFMKFMQRAIDLSERSMEEGGGPFGAVVVKDGEIVAEGTNRVTLDNDPTAHAEIQAIRKACELFVFFDMGWCEIYSSCEPCPMCLGAIYWSRIGSVYFAVNRHDAAGSEVRAEHIYEEFARPLGKRELPMVHLPCDGALEVFTDWTHMAGHVTY